MNDPVLNAIEAERQVLRARLAVLDEMERKLKRAPRPNGVVIKQPHAPKGELRGAVLEAMKQTGKVTSADLKKHLLSTGYSHRINGQYFTSTLRGLVNEKLVTKEPNGAYSTYQLARRH